MKRLGISLFAVGLLAGCASLPPRPEALQVQVVPDVVRPGTVMRLVVRAPLGTQHVTGRLDMLGSPVIPLKTLDHGATWTFVTQIPLVALIEPGHYRIVAEGRGPDGEVLRGETWITAP